MGHFPSPFVLMNWKSKVCFLLFPDKQQTFGGGGCEFVNWTVLLNSITLRNIYYTSRTSLLTLETDMEINTSNVSGDSASNKAQKRDGKETE